jgi:hypothetical protein
MRVSEHYGFSIVRRMGILSQSAQTSMSITVESGRKSFDEPGATFEDDGALAQNACSIELKCDADSASLVVRGVLDVWSLSALGVQLDQLRLTSHESLSVDLRAVTTMEREVIWFLTRFAGSVAASGRRLTIIPGPARLGVSPDS